jgi:hypothetical protein
LRRAAAIRVMRRYCRVLSDTLGQYGACDLGVACGATARKLTPRNTGPPPNFSVAPIPCDSP